MNREGSFSDSCQSVDLFLSCDVAYLKTLMHGKIHQSFFGQAMTEVSWLSAAFTIFRFHRSRISVIIFHRLPESKAVRCFPRIKAWQVLMGLN